MSDLWQDLRFALRSFRRSPGTILATVLVLSIGIGAVTLMFGTLHAVVLQPLPFEEPERLVWAWLSSEAAPENSISAFDYFDYREQADTFASLAAFLVFRPPVIVTGGDEAERVVSNFVSANLFSTLGISPELGRSFHPQEETPAADDVVILSHGFWQRRFGGDESVVGTALTVDGQPLEIVGVMPAGFDFPRGVDVWLPLKTDAGYAQGRANNNFFMLGRLRGGVSLSEAQAQVDVIAGHIAEAYPKERKGWGVRLVPLHERFFGGLRSTLLILTGLIALLPLVACANIASLLLARATDRRGELAVRFALGGSRRRVVRQLLTESLVIALAGGLAGLGLTYAGTFALRSLGPASLPRLSTLGIDGTVLVFALAVSLATVPLFGIVPALRGTRISLAEALKAGGDRGTSDGRSGFRNGLVVAQVALSLIMLIASGLLLRTYQRLQSVEPGFQAGGVLTFELQLPALKYDAPAEIEQTWAVLRERMLALPGIEAVGAIDQLPVRSGGTWNYVHTSERPPATDAEMMGAQRRFAHEGFFQTLAVPLRAGRSFEPGDRQGAPSVVIINETLAEQFSPGEDPLGRVLVLPRWDPPVHMEIIGVVGTVMENGPGATPPPIFYMAARQSPFGRTRFLVRTAGDPLDSAGVLRTTVHEVDGDIAFSQVETMESRLAGFLDQPRFRTLLVGVFAMVSLLLASVGLYGVLACFVRQRTRELSIRMALGAGAGNVFARVVGKGMAMVGMGIGLGLAGGFAGAQVLRRLLFGVAPTDAVTFASVSLCLAWVALVACLVPAWRAVRIDPCEALRVE
ncbi:MAG: ABC transporter permease [bacterium]|nr:ABC transporter permease [bacterium]